MSHDWPGIAALMLWAATSIIAFIARNWILTRITSSVQHAFNVQLENLRADLSASEERLKSELRDKEAEISVLRANALSGSAHRQALLDKRRFEAVEHVWTAVNDLAPLKNLNAMLAVLNMEEVSKEAHDPKMQRFLSNFDPATPPPQELKNTARDEQPFLPELAWAYFDAYRTINMSGYLRFQVFKVGVENPDRYLSFDTVRNILKAALPHHSDWLDHNQPEAFYYLLDELESLLLTELRAVLEAKQVGQASIEKARSIMDTLRKGEEEQAKAAIARV